MTSIEMPGYYHHVPSGTTDFAKPRVNCKSKIVNPLQPSGIHALTPAVMDKHSLFLPVAEELGKLGTRHCERYGNTVKELFFLEHKLMYAPDREHLAFVRQWLMVPSSFWAIDFHGLARYLMSEIKAGRRLGERVEFILSMLRKFPSKSARALIVEHENDVQQGNYGRFLRISDKFLALEEAKKQDPLFKAHWATFKRHFRVDDYRDADGIIRRSMMLERNRKSYDWLITSLNEEEDEMQVAFDALSCNHDLYGVRGDEPLLLKISVNMTPYGVQIGIPAYLIPDFKRDFIWSNIAELLEALGAESVGEKEARARLERIDLALRVFHASEEAIAKGIKGDSRINHIIYMSGLPENTGDRQIRKLCATAREHLGLRSEDGAALES